MTHKMNEVKDLIIKYEQMSSVYETNLKSIRQLRMRADDFEATNNHLATTLAGLRETLVEWGIEVPIPRS